MADEIKEIPKSEYEYSPKKEAELYSEMNIIDLVSFEEVQRNVEPKEEEIKQLFLLYFSSHRENQCFFA